QGGFDVLTAGVAYDFAVELVVGVFDRALTNVAARALPRSRRHFCMIKLELFAIILRDFGSRFRHVLSSLDASSSIDLMSCKFSKAYRRITQRQTGHASRSRLHALEVRSTCGNRSFPLGIGSRG